MFQLFESAARPDHTGVVHKAIEPAPGGLNLVEETRNITLGCHISLHRQRNAACRFYRGGRLASGSFVGPVVDRDSPTLGAQALGGSSAYASASPSNYGNFALHPACFLSGFQSPAKLDLLTGTLVVNTFHALFLVSGHQANMRP
jgi:hypothetical protein